MSGLVEFLLARIAEEERLARDAETVWSVIGRNPKPFPGVAHTTDDWMKSEAFALNINPWWVQKNNTARRAIIRLHARREFDVTFDRWNHAEKRTEFWTAPACEQCGHPDAWPVEWPCDTLRLLAAPYSDHPDFDPSWGVSGG